MSGRTAVVVGNPRPGSRTLEAALTVARRLTDLEPDLVVDLAELGPALLDWQDPAISALVDDVGAADLLVVASPTYKATYTGLLKLFLDRFPGGTGLRGVAVPLMLGASPRHALAAELHLRPLLVELGASVPTTALYVLDHDFDRPDAYDAWLERSRPLLEASLARPREARR
jgi:FMN reductase